MRHSLRGCDLRRRSMPRVRLDWHVAEGDPIAAGQALVHARGTGARAVDRASARRSIFCSCSRPPRRPRTPMPRSFKARIAACSTPARPFRACGPRRSTRCESAAARITAWGCSTASSSRRTTSWPRARSPSAVSAARSSGAQRCRWRSKWRTCPNCGRPSTPAPISPCSMSSRCSDARGGGHQRRPRQSR